MLLAISRCCKLFGTFCLYQRTCLCKKFVVINMLKQLFQQTVSLFHCTNINALFAARCHRVINLSVYQVKFQKYIFHIGLWLK